jgi:hypothetical protein
MTLLAAVLFFCNCARKFSYFQTSANSFFIYKIQLLEPPPPHTQKKQKGAETASLPGRYVNRVVVLARQAENRFLGSLKGLQIRVQAACMLVTMEIWSLKDQLGPGKQRAETLFALEIEESQKNYH